MFTRNNHEDYNLVSTSLIAQIRTAAHWSFSHFFYETPRNSTEYFLPNLVILLINMLHKIVMCMIDKSPGGHEAHFNDSKKLNNTCSVKNSTEFHKENLEW